MNLPILHILHILNYCQWRQHLLIVSKQCNLKALTWPQDHYAAAAVFSMKSMKDYQGRQTSKVFALFSTSLLESMQPLNIDSVYMYIFLFLSLCFCFGIPSKYLKNNFIYRFNPHWSSNYCLDCYSNTGHDVSIFKVSIKEVLALFRIVSTNTFQ